VAQLWIVRPHARPCRHRNLFDTCGRSPRLRAVLAESVADPRSADEHARCQGPRWQAFTRQHQQRRFYQMGLHPLVVRHSESLFSNEWRLLSYLH
jgi:hypothetical protein